MKKKVWREDGMQQIVDTGWKEFDSQVTAISTGQVIGGTQYSMCIRPWKETECNGFTNPEGHLLDFDLKPFRAHNIPDRILQVLTNKAREKSVILYMFYIHNKYGRIEPFFWVITDYDYHLVESQLRVGYGQNYMKRYNASREILEYITEPCETKPTLI